MRFTPDRRPAFEVEGNNGGSFVRIAETERDDVVHLTVGADCVVTVDTEISVVALAAVLTFVKDTGFTKIVERHYAEQGYDNLPEWTLPTGERASSTK